MTPSPNQSNVLAQLRNFLLQVLPAGVEVIVTQQNRIPEPKGTDFVLLTPIRQKRLETNVDTYADAAFIGSIADATMTITAVDPRFLNGKIRVGSIVYGAGLAPGTTVTAILTGTGQIGTYTVTPAGQTISSRALSTGTEQITQATEFTVQLDFHSAPISNAGDMASVVTTLMRDGYAVQQFANQSPNYGVVPLLADDARQMPFINDQQQFEWRWVVEALLQANVVVSVPQQFADSVDLTLVSVDAVFPPA